MNISHQQPATAAAGGVVLSGAYRGRRHNGTSKPTRLSAFHETDGGWAAGV